MMRRLITSLYLSLATLAGCTAEPPANSDTVGQAVSSCDSRMPELPYWEGQRLPATSESQIYLYYPDAERPGEMVLVFVDTAKLEIPFGYRAKQSSAGRLFSSFGNAAQFAGGHQPVPPRPVIPDWSLSAALITWGQTALTIPDLATEGGICKQ